MLPTNDDSEINKIYGKIIGNSFTAISKRVPSCAKPLAVAQITSGAANTPTAVIINSAKVSIPATCCTNNRVSSSDLFCL